MIMNDETRKWLLVWHTKCIQYKINTVQLGLIFRIWGLGYSINNFSLNYGIPVLDVYPLHKLNCARKVSRYLGVYFIEN